MDRRAPTTQIETILILTYSNSITIISTTTTFGSNPSLASHTSTSTIHIRRGPNALAMGMRSREYDRDSGELVEEVVEESSG